MKGGGGGGARTISVEVVDRAPLQPNDEERLVSSRQKD